MPKSRKRKKTKNKVNNNFVQRRNHIKVVEKNGFEDLQEDVKYIITENELKYLQDNIRDIKAREEDSFKRLEENTKRMFGKSRVKYDHKYKVSELLLEYGEDILSRCTGQHEFKQAIMVLVICWNTAVIANTKEEIDKELDDLLEKMGLFDKKGFFISMINKKKRFYDEHKNVIVNYDIDFSAGMTDPYVSVSSFDKDNPMQR